jgi:cytidylate kinase
VGRARARPLEAQLTVVTFSREAHSGTQDLAKRLAERLGYRYVSRDEITEAISARSGIKREPQTQESEGRSLSLWEHLGEQLSGQREAYVGALRSVITELAVHDNVVIVGHGAGLFLTDMRTVVRVFVVAPMSDRVARLQAEGVTDPVQAQKMIEDQDRESAEYLRYLFDISWMDPHHWDVVLNTGRADVNAALDMLATYTESLVRDRAESQDLRRKQIATRLEQSLIAEDLGIDHLSVRFEDEMLTLEGEALTQQERDRAETLARALAPDATIQNAIVVRPPTSA